MIKNTFIKTTHNVEQDNKNDPYPAEDTNNEKNDVSWSDIDDIAIFDVFKSSCTYRPSNQNGKL